MFNKLTRKNEVNWGRHRGNGGRWKVERERDLRWNGITVA